ncbi:hypothetical protein [uncultured Williamsia sp.]|uniref:hypothetical protein n=1 Tax=uncultured Williamsia sp. TaxID=259311 RepID=UPI0026284FC5|nr:hypothetical protein [uncultured Williamsia sp.]
MNDHPVPNDHDDDDGKDIDREELEQMLDAHRAEWRNFGEQLRKDLKGRVVQGLVTGSSHAVVSFALAQLWLWYFK